MIQAFKHDENHTLVEIDMDTAEKGSWINCFSPTDEELDHLHSLTGIPVNSLRTVMDREERSHVELEDNYIFVVVNTPVVLTTDSYDAMPLGIFLTRRFFVTVCLEKNMVLERFLNNRLISFHTYKKTRFLFQILSAASSSFLHYLQLIYRQTDAIGTQVRKSMQNKEIFRMLELQKSLTYFNFALHANESVMERLMRLRSSSISSHTLLKLYEEDEDLLEDVIIENKQALEMVGIYTNILISMMDSYSSIISNGLAQIMKFLTSVTIILAVPTVLYSLWGSNVPMPLGESPLGFPVLLIGGLVLTALVSFILWTKDML
jgi:magnesium transporter